MITSAKRPLNLWLVEDKTFLSQIGPERIRQDLKVKSHFVLNDFLYLNSKKNFSQNVANLIISLGYFRETIFFANICALVIVLTIYVSIFKYLEFSDRDMHSRHIAMKN